MLATAIFIGNFKHTKRSVAQFSPGDQRLRAESALAAAFTVPDGKTGLKQRNSPVPFLVSHAANTQTHVAAWRPIDCED